MAENDINIPIKVIGTQEAAGDLKTIEDGVKSVTDAGSQGTTGFGGMLDNSPARDEAHEKHLEQVKAEVEAVKTLEAEQAASVAAEIAGMKEKEAAAAAYAKTLEGAEEGSSKLDENVQSIGRVQKAQAVAQLAGEVGKIGAKFKEAADGVEKFDPVLAASLRNAGENLEMVSSGVTSVALGFAVGGPLGAGVAGMGVLLGSLANEWLNAGIAATEADLKIVAAMDSMTTRMSKVAIEKDKLALTQWLDVLGAEVESIKSQNDALERNRDLLEKAETAKLSLSQAKANREIAEIETNDELSQDQKIIQVAAVRERLEKEKTEAQVNREGRDVVKTEQNAEAKQAEASQLTLNADKIAKAKADVAAELKELEQKEKLRQQALAELPKAEQARDRARFFNTWVGKQQNSEYSAKAQADEDATESNAILTANRAVENPKDQKRAKALREKKEELEAAEKTARAEAEKAQADAEKQQLDAATKRREFNITARSATEDYLVDRSTRNIRTDAAAKKAQKADVEKEAKGYGKQYWDQEKEDESEAKEQQRRRDAERDLETDIVPLGRDAANAARGQGSRGINPEGFNTLAAKIAKKGDAPGDKLDLTSMFSKISQLVDMIPDSKNNTDDAKKLRDVEARIEKKIAALAAREKINRDGR